MEFTRDSSDGASQSPTMIAQWPVGRKNLIFYQEGCVPPSARRAGRREFHAKREGSSPPDSGPFSLRSNGHHECFVWIPIATESRSGVGPE